MRVALDARSLSAPVLRGWDRYTVGLVGELVRRGVEVTFLHRAREPLRVEHIAGLGCRVVGLRDLSGLHWEQVVLPLALRRGRFDLFHAPAEHGVPLAAPCPVVLTIHSVTGHSYLDLIGRGLLPGRLRDYLGSDRPSTWNFADSYLRAQVARADHILTPSDFCRKEVIRFLHIPPERVTTTRLAVHAQFQQPAQPESVRAETLERLGVRKPYLLYVGGYELHKNVGGLLETFALVQATRPELSLVLVGTKSLPDAVRQKAAGLGLVPGRDVVFLVNITDELTDLYDDAELLVTLSWRETFCLPALEAMTRGLPVVASAWGGAPEVVGEAGRLVDPRDHAAARDAILDLISREHRIERRERARAQSQRFTWTQTALETLNVYLSLLGAPAQEFQEATVEPPRP